MQRHGRQQPVEDGVNALCPAIPDYLRRNRTPPDKPAGDTVNGELLRKTRWNVL